MKTLRPGDIVVMNDKLKRDLCKKCGLKGKHKGPFMDDNECIGCSRAHVKEFGDCVGVVVGLMDLNNCPPGDPNYEDSKVGPELDVRWQPSRLKYGYHPKYLTLVTSVKKLRKG